jgi:ATP-dependent DNA helicase RecG
MYERSRSSLSGNSKLTASFRATSGQLTAFLPEAEPDELAETLVAFANADGGMVYIGATEGGQPTGSIFAEDLDGLVEQAERRCRPPIPVTWDLIEVGGDVIYLGQVYRSAQVHTLDDGRLLVRTGAENRTLSGEQVEQVVNSRTFGDYEAEPVPGATRADLDEGVLEEFVRVWEDREGHQLTRPLDDLLIEKGWLVPDGRPTVAGILLFGKNPTTFLPRCGVTFVRFEGESVRKPTGEASYGRRVEVNAALPRTITRVWDILKEEIHRGAVVRGLSREEQWIYPPNAIREAFINAVAHRDYQIKGRGIEVRMFPGKLEIQSPGGLPGFITLDNIVEEHFSRNPRIVNGLYQWGFIEELGMGVDVMIEEMVNAGHPVPDMKADESMFKVTFSTEKQRDPLPLSVTGTTMNERQTKALTYIHEHGRIRSRDYQDLCPDVSPETLRLDLADLVDRGVLLKIGQKRGTYYILK